MLRFAAIPLLLLIAACDTGDAQLTADDVIAKHIEARGGADAIESIRSVKIDLEIVEPEFTVTGTYVADRRGWMRIDVFAEGTRVFTEALGPDGGWQMFGDGEIADLSPDGYSALIRGVRSNLYGLHELEQFSYRHEWVGETEIEDRAVIELQQIADDGFSKQLYFDLESWFVVADAETSALHPDIDSTQEPQITYYSEFVMQDGIRFSNRTDVINMDSGEEMQTTRVTNRELNPDLEEEIFKRPAPQN